MNNDETLTDEELKAYELGISVGKHHARAAKASLDNDEFESLIAAVIDQQNEDDEHFEFYAEGIEDGADIGWFEKHRETAEELFLLTDPAARYSGDLVCYVWADGGEHEFRVRVETVDGDRLIGHVRLKLKDVLVSSDADEDNYSTIARGALEQLLLQAFEKDDLTLIDLVDGSSEDGIWITTEYNDRWDVMGDPNTEGDDGDDDDDDDDDDE